MREPETIELVKIGASYGPARQSTTRRVFCMIAALALLFFGLWVFGITLYTGGGRFYGMALIGGGTLAAIGAAWIFEDFIRAVPTE